MSDNSAITHLNESPREYSVALTDKVLPGCAKFSCSLPSGRRLAFDRAGQKATKDAKAVAPTTSHDKVEIDLQTARDLARQGYKLTPDPLAARKAVKKEN